MSVLLCETPKCSIATETSFSSSSESNIKCLDGIQLHMNTKSSLLCGNVAFHTLCIDEEGTAAYIGVPLGLRHPGANPRGTAATFSD